MVKARDSLLTIGFCTEKWLGNADNFSDAYSLYYQCTDDGYLIEGGVQKDLYACGSRNGELVECMVEWPKRVSWSKGGKLLAECDVPAAMKGRLVYFSIILKYEGDSVEVSSVE